MDVEGNVERNADHQRQKVWNGCKIVVKVSLIMFSYFYREHELQVWVDHLYNTNIYETFEIISRQKIVTLLSIFYFPPKIWEVYTWDFSQNVGKISTHWKCSNYFDFDSTYMAVRRWLENLKRVFPPIIIQHYSCSSNRDHYYWAIMDDDQLLLFYFLQWSFYATTLVHLSINTDLQDYRPKIFRPFNIELRIDKFR